MIIGLGGFHEKSHCGYCNTTDGSRIFGFTATLASPQEYRNLIDMGWRRSGTFCYKPDLSKSCCPQYTIRLECSRFKPTKEHRQLLNRLAKHVLPHPAHVKHKGKNNAFDFDSAVDAVLFSPHSDLRVVLSSNELTQEKFDLYKKYQMAIHNDAESDVTHNSFKRFLCVDPFEANTDVCDDDDDPPDGAYHYLYYLKDKLVAIGVVDLLPESLSSVYFIWDPECAHLGLGNLGALFEIALARKYNRPFYYMGYYIHNCVKMRYKGKYSPSYLLDPQYSLIEKESDHWIPLKTFTSHLDADTKYYTSVSHVPQDQPIPGAYDSKNYTIALLYEVSPKTYVPLSLDLITDDGKEFILPYIDELNVVLGPLAKHTFVLINA